MGLKEAKLAYKEQILDKVYPITYNIRPFLDNYTKLKLFCLSLFSESSQK